jgi:hypothetical protein
MLGDSMWRGLSKSLPLTLTLSPLREERNGEREQTAVHRQLRVNRVEATVPERQCNLVYGLSKPHIVARSSNATALVT